MSLQFASFRGIPFFVESDTQSGGRRLAIKQMPGRSNPYIADLGRKDRTFTVNGRVIGDDYVDQIKSLQDAADTEGPGEFIDSYVGRKLVSVESFSLTFTDSQTRVASFTYNFVEYSEVDNKPQPSLDLKTKVIKSADSLLSNAKQEFTDMYSLSNKPRFVLNRCIDGAITTVSSINKTLSSAMSSDLFFYTSSRIGAEVESLLMTPQLFAEAIIELFGSTKEIYDFGQQVEELLELFDSIEIVDESTDSPAVLNQNQLNLFIKAAVLSQVAQLISNTNFETYDDAALYAGKLVNAIEFIESAVSDILFESLYTLKTSTSHYIAANYTEYPRITTIELTESVPSIVLSYRLYASLDMADQIARRNCAIHPGFIPAGTPVKVAVL